MSLNVFLKVVEIQTKLASLFPFIIGVLFSMTYFGEVQWGNTLVFFIGMVVFDMATTAINNYMDFKKAKSDVYKYEENIIGQSGVSPQLVRNMIFAMIAFTAVVGAYLTVQTAAPKSPVRTITSPACAFCPMILAIASVSNGLFRTMFIFLPPICKNLCMKVYRKFNKLTSGSFKKIKLRPKCPGNLNFYFAYLSCFDIVN